MKTLLEQIADAIVVEEGAIGSAFILSNGKVVSSEGLISSMRDSAFSLGVSNQVEKKDLKSKDILEIFPAVAGLVEKSSRQSSEEIVRFSGNLSYSSLADSSVVEPPYPPDVMQQIFEMEETNYRCCRVKATDSIGRGYSLKNTVPVLSKGNTDIVDLDGSDNSFQGSSGITKEVFQQQLDEVTAFISECSKIGDFEDVLEMASIDYEAIGWCAIEVIRSMDMKVKQLSHIPAARIKPLAGWKGFVEFEEGTDNVRAYYQNFGDKLVKQDGEVTETYNPRLHGELSTSNLEWHLMDFKTGEKTVDFGQSANEVIWIKNNHPNTIYYGFADCIPALGAIIANVKIRNYFHQFFDHSAVPRFAIVVEGGKLSEPVMELINEYFSNEVKSSDRSTLIINVPSLRGEVKIRFEKLDTDQKEGDFLKTFDVNQKSIRTAHGVSGAIIGITDDAELGAGKGMSQAEIYKDRIVIPRQKKWASAINKLLRLGLGVNYVKIEFHPLDVKDRMVEAQILTLLQDRGDLSIDEVRDRFDYPPTEGGNRKYLKIKNNEGLLFIDSVDDATGKVMMAVDAPVEPVGDPVVDPAVDPVVEEDDDPTPLPDPPVT